MFSDPRETAEQRLEGVAKVCAIIVGLGLLALIASIGVLVWHFVARFA